MGRKMQVRVVKLVKNKVCNDEEAEEVQQTGCNHYLKPHCVSETPVAAEAGFGFEDVQFGAEIILAVSSSSVGVPSMLRGECCEECRIIPSLAWCAIGHSRPCILGLPMHSGQGRNVWEQQRETAAGRAQPDPGWRAGA